ncbi:MAG: uncharacterized membrane protein YraQ (UPF0718 family) [Verrucomicrobiales bacterium]|jgi:uncharacterized membrane protein YraQ (UPF0718 family)
MGLDLAQISTAFISLLLEGLPFIFLGTLISGFIDAYLPPWAMERLLPKRRVFAILISGLLGIVFPVCECAIVPVIGRLIRKGLPVSCAVTYMLAAPIINPITAMSTMIGFSGGSSEMGPLMGNFQHHPIFMTVSRLLIAYFVCVLVGLLIQRVSASSIMRSHVLKAMEDNKQTQESGEGQSIFGTIRSSLKDGARLIVAFRTAMRDSVDTGMYFTIGAALTAIFNTSTLQKGLGDLMSSHITVAVATLMALAFILSLCSTSDAFVAATLKVAFPSQAYEYAAKLGFLVFGPMVDVKLLFMYSSIFRAKFVWGLVIGLFFIISIICSLWSLIPVERLPF